MTRAEFNFYGSEVDAVAGIRCYVSRWDSLTTRYLKFLGGKLVGMGELQEVVEGSVVFTYSAVVAGCAAFASVKNGHV